MIHLWACQFVHAFSIFGNQHLILCQLGFASVQLQQKDPMHDASMGHSVRPLKAEATDQTEGK